MNQKLNTPITSLPSTSPLTIKRFQSLNINTYWDLLNYFPIRYENYSITSRIGEVQEGEIVTVTGTVTKSVNQYVRSRMTIQKVTIDDGSGKMELVWYNQPYLVKTFKEGTRVAVAGLVKRFLNTYSLETKEYEVLNSGDSHYLHTGKIVPIYSEKHGLSSRTIREKIYYVINHYLLQQDSVEEFMPEKILSYNHLISEKEAYLSIHFPENKAAVQDSTKRLSFDELFTTQLAAQLVKLDWKKERVTNEFISSPQVEEKINLFISSLPFNLTSAQQRVVNEILVDLRKTEPMNRFVQGDVGSGKTVVAAIAAYYAYLSGFQSLIMAPTEILALQHYATISRLFKDTEIKVGLHTGSQKIKKTKGKFETMPYDIVVGTHALISENLSFSRVGLVVIDEQHRFGVAQRASLKNKGLNPHLLTMTATPIPRTVMLTIYGELDLSVIDEMPKGRLPIKTYVVGGEKQKDAFHWIKKQMNQEKIQVFFIYPLIEESESETLKTIKAATKEYEYLKQTVFPEYKLGLLHGRMKPKEKEEVMAKFKNKDFDILVSTSVVEVGIDVPNATIIVIEGAQRFGMAQLHQLRGRVGRGDKQSYCLLFTDTKEGRDRLKYFSQTTNGMKLAEYDLRTRGPGDLYGRRQHGYSDLKIADLADLPLIEQTKMAVSYFISHYTLHDYTLLAQRIKQYNVEQVARD